METIIVLLVVGLVLMSGLFLVKNLLYDNTKREQGPQNVRGLDSQEIKEKFRQLNSVASQIRI